MVSDGRHQAQLSTFKFQNQKFGNVIYGYENGSDQLTIHQDLNFTQVNGFDPVGQKSSSRGASLIIPPRDVDVLIFKMDPRNQDGYSLAFQVTNEEVFPQ